MNRQLIKRIVAFLLAAALILGLLPVLAFAGETGSVTIKLHYHRPDGDYTGWSVWFWNRDQEGSDTPFAQENGEMVATFQTEPGIDSVGFTVKLSDWAAKDVEEDQFIYVAPYTSGTLHIYVESGVKGYRTVLGNDIVSDIRIRDSLYRDGVGVRVAMTGKIDPSALTVTGPEGEVTIISTSDDGSNIYTLVPEAPLDLTAEYTLHFAGSVFRIKLPSIFSTAAFEEEFTYEGDDLGATWTPEQTAFRVWAPTATAVKVNLYTTGDPEANDMFDQIEMTSDVRGTWIATVEGNLNGVYYTYQVDVDGMTNIACDPYARATGVNGKRAMVIDLDSTDPEGWETDTDPHAGLNITDVVIYELHVRDLSVDENSGIRNKGKFLGLIETGTTSPDGIPTGLDHIRNLGITHIHLLPSYDYGSVDETRLEDNVFNWGYDPVNYNVPEGSYATDPYHGEVRVKEFKQMVKGLHDNGISVIMDVVYNHVYSGTEFCFNRIVPLYFSRVNESGAFSNGSACGNDTASERSMVKKYIVDSVKYWADEYHIDGFRFDLVGLIDTETINAVMEEVHKTHPNVIFYGEGWTMTTQVTKNGYTMTTQANAEYVPDFAFFSDTLRDALKGSAFNSSEKGYVSGSSAYAGNIAKCFLGAPGWCENPTQTINYASCHDNHTLFDRIVLATADSSREDQIRMNNLAAAIVMTSQGVPFIHAGEEMLRSKPLPEGGFDHNSYNNTDLVNNLKWADMSKEEYRQVYAYYQGLIAFRKAHPALRMTTAAEVSQYITRTQDLDYGVLGFHITPGANGEENALYVIFNPNPEATTVPLPQGQWSIFINGESAGTEVLGTASETVTVAPISAMVLVLTTEEAEDPQIIVGDSEEDSIGIIGGADGPTTIFVSGNWGGLIAIAAAVMAAGIAVIVALKKRKK